MAAVKSKNSQNMSKAKRIIVLCIVVLVAIPLTLGLVRSKTKNNFIPYHGSTYTFYYPENWIVSQNDRNDINGTEFFLRPPEGAPPETPHVTIDVAPATQTASNKLTAPFTIFKYAKTLSSVHGVQAQKYTTVVHSSEGVLHATAYVFHANGNIYLVSLGYKQAAPDTQLENDFSQIIKTFTPQ